MDIIRFRVDFISEGKHTRTLFLKSYDWVSLFSEEGLRTIFRDKIKAQYKDVDPSSYVFHTPNHAPTDDKLVKVGSFWRISPGTYNKMIVKNAAEKELQSVEKRLFEEQAAPEPMTVAKVFEQSAIRKHLPKLTVPDSVKKGLEQSLDKTKKKDKVFDIVLVLGLAVLITIIVVFTALGGMS